MIRITMNRKAARRLAAGTALAALTILAASACSHLMMMAHGHTDIEPPAADEFGFGPRVSETGGYRASIQPAEPIRVGRMHSWTLRVEDRDGRAVDGVEIAVDGGMPQHGHGLPTRPRVTRALGGGAYQVDGMRFNMGGWWVVTFDIAGAAGPDRVTFNLDL